MVSERAEQAAAHTSLRERNKAARRGRVLAAARAIFAERGYDDATTREIAARAGVAVGTVFVYARDKRDLLMTIVNDDLEDVTEASFADVDARPDRPFIDKVLGLFEPRYRYWARDPELSAFALHETGGARVHDVPSESLRFRHRRHRVIDKIAGLVADEQRAGRLGRPDTPDEIAHFIMGIYLAQARFWLTETEPRVDDGIARLRRHLEIAVHGLRP